MFLIQILLPLYDNRNQRLPAALHTGTRDELVARFGGITAYTRAPVEGLWHEDGQPTVRDELIIYEVMSDTLDADWWRGYRQQLEGRFRQERIVVRAQEVQML